MTEAMGHRERVMASLRGEDVDRPPVSMWRHFFDRETTAGGIAEAMLDFQGRHDWDFMKVNPRASYHAEDWGLRVAYNHSGPPSVAATPIGAPEDWLRLERLDVTQGVLGEHLRALEAIARGLDRQVPFLMTVFTPLSIASRLVPSEETFVRHLREQWDYLRQALEVVTETFTAFSKACLDRGASGLFYATTSWATTDSMTQDEYARYARPYDLKLLEALPEAEFHLLHVCRDNNMLAALKDYPVHAFNWDARGAGNPSLAEGKALLGRRAVVGGLDHRRGLLQSTADEMACEAEGIRAAMGNSGWMLAPGCTFSPDTPEANVAAVRRALSDP